MIAEPAHRNEALLTWYAAHRRTLPWRTDPEPYSVLVSELMLQQTQVSRVVPKYEAFMERFPTVDHLGRAGTAEVLEAWSGLGYNSRAIRLRDAARIIAAEGWPTDVKGLEQLPGVGPYTAAAVASIAFAEPVPAVDTNLRRVLSRWAGEPLSGTELQEAAEAAVDPDAGSWNQALMDLGSSLCRPTNPMCGDCPVSEWCSDPTIYQPPARQSTFEGSRRQLRGAMVRAHLEGDDLRSVGESLGRTSEEIESVLQDLIDEGLIPDTGHRTSDVDDE